MDSEIAALHAAARRKKLFAFITLVAVVAGVYYYGRDKLGAVAVTAYKQQRAGLRVTAKRNGIKLVLDGKEIGMLPQEVKDLAPGDHSVVFEGGDRYAVQKSTITLDPDQTKLLELVSLKVTKGAATFDVKTPGTSIALVSTEERRALTDYSHPIDIDNAQNWTLEATKPGFKPLTMPVAFDDDAEKTFVVALTEPIRSTEDGPQQDVSETPGPRAGRGASARAEPAASPRAAAPAPLSRPERAAASPSPSLPAPPTPAQAAPVPAPARAVQAGAAAGMCTLNINSIPTSRITLDGRFIGITPKVGISVPAGAHSVLLVSDSGRKSASASCKAGEQKTIAIRLSQ